jgi:hypothetical protein
VSCVGVFDDIKCTLLIHKKKSSAINVQKIKDKEANKYKSNHIEEFRTNNKFSPSRIILSQNERLLLKKGLRFHTVV